MVFYGNVEKIEKSLSLTGVDVNNKDVDKKTPLMFDSQIGHIEAVILLLSKNASVNDKDNMEFDSMDIVLNCKYANILKFSSSEHDKVRYNFISKIGILYTEENAAFVSDDEEYNEMPELIPL